MQVDPSGGLRDDYELKLNSYDLSVDIELYDAVQRLRFEHPEVHAVVLTGGVDKVFCAGANIQMLAGSSHHHKVNFCKFTNETRNAIEDATAHSGQVWIAAVNGTAAGGGYELALACDEIVLIDDLASAVSLPEVPLLAVLPGTGGLTRVVDKRHVRRDLADVFATRAEGVKGRQAVEWGLVDGVGAAQPVRGASSASGPRPAPPTPTARRRGPASRSRRCAGPWTTTPMAPYDHVEVRIDRELGAATITVHGPSGPQPADGRGAGRRPAPRVAAGRLPGARRRRAPPALQRAGGRHVGAADHGATRPPCSPPTTCSATTGPLAGPGGPPLLGPDAEAPRPVGPDARRADRAGQLLRRHAGRAGAGRRPVVHARRRVAAGRTATQTGRATGRPRCS